MAEIKNLDELKKKQEKMEERKTDSLKIIKDAVEDMAGTLKDIKYLLQEIEFFEKTKR